MNNMNIQKFLNNLLEALFRIFLSIKVSVPPKVTPAAPDALANEILKYNNSLTFFVGGKTYSNGVSTLHQITQAQANEIALAVRKYNQMYPELTIPYILGCLAIESCLDPAAENKNTEKGGSNPNNNPMGYDEGIAQLKLMYLPDIDGVTLAQKLNFALTPEHAIGAFCENMVGKLKWAEQTIANNTSSVPDPRLSNKYLLATGAYNFGEGGMLDKYQSGEFPNHCAHVQSLEQAFAKALGLPSVTNH